MSEDSRTLAARREALSVLVADLFVQYHEPIFAYLYRLVDDRELAHDLMQETFLRIFRTRQKLPQVENHRAWIYRTASNLAFDTLKRRRRFTWLPWRSTDVVQRATPDIARQVTQQARVEQALAELSPTYRAPLLLYSHYGFSVREVAEALDVSEAAVKTRLYRAREQFRQVYLGSEQA